MGKRIKGNEDYEKGYRNGYRAGFQTNYRKRTRRELLDLSRVVLQKTCRNDGTDYSGCDQFICSECGIHLQDWVLIDMLDYYDGIVHEYEFKYCPNCGAKVEEE